MNYRLPLVTLTTEQTDSPAPVASQARTGDWKERQHRDCIG